MDVQNLRRGARLFSPMALAFVAGIFAVGCGGGDAAEGTAADSTTAAAPAAPAEPAASVITADQLKTSSKSFVGRMVKVENLGVAQAVGTEAVFLDVPQSPFLVKVPAGTVLPAVGAHVTVIGMMKAMNDSTMKDWITKGLVPEQDKILIEFATEYIDAQSITSQP